jgi:hypothetical protein
MDKIKIETILDQYNSVHPILNAILVEMWQISTLFVDINNSDLGSFNSII